MKKIKDIENSIIIEVLDREKKFEIIEEVEDLLRANKNIKYKLVDENNKKVIDEEIKSKYKDVILKRGSRIFLGCEEHVLEEDFTIQELMEEIKDDPNWVGIDYRNISFNRNGELIIHNKLPIRVNGAFGIDIIIEVINTHSTEIVNVFTQLVNGGLYLNKVFEAWAGYKRAIVALKALKRKIKVRLIGEYICLDLFKIENIMKYLEQEYMNKYEDKKIYMHYKNIQDEMGNSFYCFNIVINNINRIFVYDSNDKIIFESTSGTDIFNVQMDINNGTII